MLAVCKESLAFGTPEVPDALVLLPRSEHAIVVEKKTQTLFVYKSEEKGIELVSKYPCSTGEVAGPKALAGDKKTPEGVYFLKDEYEDRYLTPVYGKKAFPSDYPNFLDLRQGKQGSAIWIHGTDKALKPMESNGCVAMDNKGILELARMIHLDSTPLIIVETVSFASASDRENLRQQSLDLIERWRESLLTGSYHAYLRFYAEDYLPEIAWWEAWIKTRTAFLEKGVPLNLQLENTGLYAHGDVVVALMDMTLSTAKEKSYLGKRQLFIRIAGNHPAIVGDLYQKRAESYQAGDIPILAASMKMGSTMDAALEKPVLPDATLVAEKETGQTDAVKPAVEKKTVKEDAVKPVAEKKAKKGDTVKPPAVRKAGQDGSVNQAVVKTVEQWLAAWSSKDLTGYADFYANDFVSEGLGKKAWVARKKLLAKRYKYIRVSGSGYKVIRSNGRYAVSFLQKYESSGLSTRGMKQLEMVNIGGAWKIFRENWKGK